MLKNDEKQFFNDVKQRFLEICKISQICKRAKKIETIEIHSKNTL
jgi:hypothetical protein